jgi:hypothetical protein
MEERLRKGVRSIIIQPNKSDALNNKVNIILRQGYLFKNVIIFIVFS